MPSKNRTETLASYIAFSICQQSSSPLYRPIPNHFQSTHFQKTMLVFGGRVHSIIAVMRIPRVDFRVRQSTSVQKKIHTYNSRRLIFVRL